MVVVVAAELAFNTTDRAFFFFEVWGVGPGGWEGGGREGGREGVGRMSRTGTDAAP